MCLCVTRKKRRKIKRKKIRATFFYFLRFLRVMDDLRCEHEEPLRVRIRTRTENSAYEVIGASRGEGGGRDVHEAVKGKLLFVCVEMFTREKERERERERE